MRDPARRAGRARPRAAPLAGRRSSPTRRASPVLTPARPARPGLPRRAARAGARLLPGGRLRRAGAAGRAGHPRARLGQPALLAAARLARRGAGAARDPARRRDHRRHARSCWRRAWTPGRCTGWSPRPIRPRDTAGDLLDRLADSGAGLLVGHARRHRRRHARAAAAARRGVSHRAEGDRRRRAGATGPRRRCAVDRLVRAVTPGPGAWTTFRGERLELGPVRPAAGRRAELEARASCTSRSGGCWSAPATHRVALGEVQPAGKRAMPAADWARGVRIEPGELLR